MEFYKDKQGREIREYDGFHLYNLYLVGSDDVSIFDCKRTTIRKWGKQITEIEVRQILPNLDQLRRQADHGRRWISFQNSRLVPVSFWTPDYERECRINEMETKVKSANLGELRNFLDNNKDLPDDALLMVHVVFGTLGGGEETQKSIVALDSISFIETSEGPPPKSKIELCFHVRCWQHLSCPPAGRFANSKERIGPLMLRLDQSEDVEQ
jgi:hypothetical protein